MGVSVYTILITLRISRITQIGVFKEFVSGMKLFCTRTTDAETLHDATCLCCTYFFQRAKVDAIVVTCLQIKDEVVEWGELGRGRGLWLLRCALLSKSRCDVI